MNIILGATGNIGSELIPKLTSMSKDCVLLSRNPDQLTQRYPDFSARYADLSSQSSLLEAFKGGKTLFLVSPNNPQMEQEQFNAINAAKAAGIKHIIKISATPSTVSEFSHSAVGAAHWQVEEHLREHFEHFAILRCNFFMQNLLDKPVEMLKTSNTLKMPFSKKTPFCYLDAGDIADCVKALLRNPPKGDCVYHLAGNHSSFSEVVEVLSSITQRDIKYKKVPAWVMYLVLRFKGTPKWLAHHQVEMAKLFEKGHAGHKSMDISMLLGREPTSLKSFLLKNQARFQ